LLEFAVKDQEGLVDNVFGVLLIESAPTCVIDQSEPVLVVEQHEVSL